MPATAFAPAAAPVRRRPVPRHERPARPAPPRLRIVDDARLRAAQRRRRMRLVVAVAAVVTTASLFALAAFNAMLVSGQGRLDQLERSVTEAQSQYSANRLRVAELEAPEHVIEAARDRLGMVPPPEVKYLTPSEPVAEEVRGTAPATPSPKADSGTSWAAAKPYLSSRP